MEDVRLNFFFSEVKKIKKQNELNIKETSLKKNKKKPV